MKLKIRDATEADLVTLYDISRIVHLGSYLDVIDPSQFERLKKHYAVSVERRQAYVDKRTRQLHDPKWRIRVAEQDGRIVGFKLSERHSDGVSHGAGLYVDLHAQGQGIGKQLMLDWIDAMPSNSKLRLDVVEKNYTARRLYEKLGFAVDGTTDRTYFGEKMLSMSLQKH